MERAEQLPRQISTHQATLGVAGSPNTRPISISSGVDGRGMNNAGTEHMDAQRLMPNHFVVPLMILAHGPEGPPGATPLMYFFHSRVPLPPLQGNSTLASLGILRTSEVSSELYGPFTSLVEESLSFFGRRMSFLIK